MGPAEGRPSPGGWQARTPSVAQAVPLGGVTWLLGPSAPQSAGGVMVAWTDESFAQNRAERGLEQSPRNTVRMGLTASAGLSPICRDQT